MQFLLAALLLLDGDRGQPGVMVEPRGPIHEAFAQPLNRKPEPMPVVPKKPPPPVPEEPTEQKPAGVNVQWIPGYWAWDLETKDFIWVSGFWRDPPPNRHWVAGRWTEALGGWQYVPGFWAGNGAGNMPPLPQPPQSIDNGPSVPAPSDESFYVPGQWVYRGASYVWRPGFWFSSYAGWVWMPGSYRWQPDGYVYVDGYWDYPLESRGLLYAPVTFAYPYWTTPGWSYRPWFAVNLGGLYGSLYVNPFWGGYYYGNYFGRPGFYPYRAWGNRYWDTLHGYYAYHNYGNARWSPGRSAYASAYRGGVTHYGSSSVGHYSTARASYYHASNYGGGHSFSAGHAQGSMHYAAAPHGHNGGGGGGGHHR
jgi:hypothetical protein